METHPPAINHHRSLRQHRQATSQPTSHRYPFFHSGYVNVKSDKNAKGEDVETREVKSLTYRELYDSAFDLGKGILHRNFTYHESLYGMEFVGVYSKNRYEWFMFDWACVLFGITSVPLYDTLGF